MNPSRFAGLASCLVVASLTGCSIWSAEPKQSPPAAPVIAAAPEGGEYQAAWPVLEGFAIDPVADRAQKAGLVLDVGLSLRRQCPRTPAQFDFDQAEVRQRDQEALRTLAECLTRGPLAHRRLALVGHADAKGDPHYNVGLSLRRADAVKQVLVRQGVAANRIILASRGARDAVGYAGYTDAIDRRVDIRLVH